MYRSYVYARARVCVCVYMCARECVRVRMCMRVCACVLYALNQENLYISKEGQKGLWPVRVRRSKYPLLILL